MTTLETDDQQSRQKRFTYRAELILKSSGWYEGRNGFFAPPSFPDMPDWELFPAAQKILDEFSGLTIQWQPSERDAYRYNIQFDAKFPWSFYDYGQRYLKQFGKRLYPLAEFGAPYLFIDEDEVVVINYFVSVDSGIVGQGFDASLEKLILGRRYNVNRLTI